MDGFDIVYEACAYDFDKMVRGQENSSIEQFIRVIKLCNGLNVTKDDIQSVFDFIVHEGEYEGVNVADEVKWNFYDALDMSIIN